MTQDQMTKIQELLNEEKWTRATLNSYTIANFQSLDKILEMITDRKELDEIKETCDEHLTHTKNSIVALYLSGIISLSRQLVDDTNLVMLITIFTDNHKWNIVEYLCQRILEFGENKFALRTLSDCYQNENEEEKMYEIWERLIRVDYEEADIVRAIAEKKDADGEDESAIDYYRKALHRYINKKLFTNVREIWQVLLQKSPDDIDFFFNVEKKIAGAISEERASQLLEELYQEYRKSESWNTAIEILKKILDYDPKNQWARKEIVECYRSKYVEHSHLDEYIKLSNLTQSWRNVHDAINDFEKHIAFETGNFVCHRSWGIGRIKTIKGDDITINFTRKRNHVMSLKMAVNALTSLGKNHIWVLKVTWTKEKLHDKVKNDIPWALKNIIRSFDNAAGMKMVKAELVPGVLSPGEWTSWSTEARKILKTDTNFGVIPEKPDYYTVRENKISFEENSFNKFTADKDFWSRVRTFLDFVSSDPESEYFAEMFSYFTGFLRSFSNVSELVVSSYLLVQRTIKKYPFLNPGLDFTFRDLLTDVDDLVALFISITDSDLKKDFLEKVKVLDNWPELYVSLFPHSLNRYILDQLSAAGREDMIQRLVSHVTDHYRDTREAFIWLARNIQDRAWFEKYGVGFEKILIGMLHLLDITFREIVNRREVSFNRKLNKQVQSYLFKDGILEDYLLEADEDSVIRLYSLVADVKDLDPSIRIELKHKIIEKYPNFKFIGEIQTGTVNRGLIVTAKRYEERQKELQRILEVDVPNNSKEISVALELGDLRENAEYKAAKEHQDMLNNSVAKLRDEIDRAQIFDKTLLDISKISFGTKVALVNQRTNSREEYTILGPWESDPNNRVISYLSPFGSELLNHVKGDTISFVINEREYQYTVEEITAGDK